MKTSRSVSQERTETKSEKEYIWLRTKIYMLCYNKANVLSVYKNAFCLIKWNMESYLDIKRNSILGFKVSKDVYKRVDCNMSSASAYSTVMDNNTSNEP